MKDKITTIITDLDGCLWDGTLAERQSVSVNEEYFGCLKDLYKKGIQLFVVSKNNYDDVNNEFYSKGINNKIFTKIIANWEPKYLNIEKLLQQTNIRPETVIFIDDNPFELKEVNTILPEIKCVKFSEWSGILTNNYFKSLKQQSESEIQQRINRYRTAISYSRLKEETFKEDESFLKALNRKMAIGEICSPEDTERFAKLLSLTHRINFNPEKFKNLDEAKTSLEEAMKQGHKLYGVSVWENDLPLGLSGGFVIKFSGETAYIEDATFSCGIMGRDFEQKSFIELVKQLKKIGIKKVIFLITHTSTNLRIIEILNELEFKKTNLYNRKTSFSLNLDNYKPVKSYDWIEVIDNAGFSEHFGISSVIDFFDHHVIPLLKNGSSIINLGTGHGEVIGHLQRERKDLFYKYLEKIQVLYTKVDLEKIPEENNLIGNAENLKDIIKDESFNIVMAIELLEHTQHFWKVIDEMIRICKVNGYIFITVPTFNYPKHEYPIDLWRIGPQTLLSFFPEDKFEKIRCIREGDQKYPRRLLLLLRKKKSFIADHSFPPGGKTNWKTGITFFK